MELFGSYAYFALSGDDFDPAEITKRLGIEASRSRRKGDQGTYNTCLKFSSWQLSSEKGKEYFDIDQLVDEVISQLTDKVDTIIQLKSEFKLQSILGIVLWIDTNQDQSTPAIGHDLKTIEFLYKTQTETDIDIYRFDSSEESLSK